MKIKLLAMVFLLILAMSSTSVLADDLENVTISVSVASSVDIQVSPNTLNWVGVTPGDAGGVNTTTITNIGSEPVDEIYTYMVDLFVDESSNPIGTEDPTNYAAGGFVVMKNSSGGSYNYVGRLDWNDTSLTTKPASATFSVNGGEVPAWGWYRMNSSSSNTGKWLWELGNGTDGYCNSSTAEFEIEADEDDGSAGTRTPDQVAEYVGNAGAWGVFNMSTGGPLAGQCIAAYYTCDRIYIYNYDHRTTPNFNQCANLDYIQSSALNTTKSHIINVDVWVPKGIPYGSDGSTTASSMTIYATTA